MVKNGCPTLVAVVVNAWDGRGFDSLQVQPLEGRIAMETVFVEVRAAEGGDDAKDLVRDQVAIYVKATVRRCL